MKKQTILQANMKRHKVVMLGILFIMIVISYALISVIGIWLNANDYLTSELDRMNYGDLTIWTNTVVEEKQILEDVAQLDEVEQVSFQPLIFSNYEIFDQQSDSEGQLIVYEPEQYPYRIFDESGQGYQEGEVEVLPGKLYVSPSLLATLHAQVGDWIAFPIARQGQTKVFQIKGTFEDPFMGSSMIGMKSFLISQEDYDEINQIIQNAGIDALARAGQMVHIEQADNDTLSSAAFNKLINEQTILGNSVEFAHSKAAISSFMLILQQAFAGLCMVFALILLIVSAIIVSFSIATSIDQDETHIGILKTIGYDANRIRSLIQRQYLIVIAIGCVLGLCCSIATLPVISHMMVSFSGILTPSTPRLLIWFYFFIVILVFFYALIKIKTRRIRTISPMGIIQEHHQAHTSYNSLKQSFLLIRISLRQLLSAKRRYISVCITSLLLVFVTSTITRMNDWLGPDGEGMMDAFHPADFDLGVQLIGEHDQEEMVQLIEQHSAIIDTYDLAMPSVSLNGVDYTANVIDEPERFHIQVGETSEQADEIVITDVVAADLDLQLQDQVTLSYHGVDATYTVVGIYQCANDMGGNIGMSKEGFLRIGEDAQDLWCHHYFLSSPEKTQEIMDQLGERYGGDIFLHENTWPGLISIIHAMHTLMIVMYVVTTLFVLVITIMTVIKLFLFEKRTLSIYQTLGYTTSQLRMTFAIRYGIISSIGASLGVIMSTLCSDYLVGMLMNAYGISDFSSHPGIETILFPAVLVSVLFVIFAYIVSAKIASLELHELVSE